MAEPDSPPGQDDSERLAGSHSAESPAADDAAGEQATEEGRGATRSAGGAPAERQPAAVRRAACPRCGDFASGDDLLTFWNGKTLCALCCERLMAPECVDRVRQDPGFTFQASGPPALGWLFIGASIMAGLALVIFVDPGLFLFLIAAVSLIPLMGFSLNRTVRFANGRIRLERRGLSDVDCYAVDLERYVFFGALDRDERPAEVAITLNPRGTSRKLVRLTGTQKELRWLKTILELP